MTNCTICTENFNKSNRSVVTCPYCSEQSCQSCVREYLMGLNSDKPKCMHCSREWTLDFVSQVTAKVFHNDQYRNHRVKFYLESERSLLPATQELIERREELTNKKNKEISILNESVLYYNKTETKLLAMLEQVRNQRVDIINSKNQIFVNFHFEYNSLSGNYSVGIMCQCPNESCRGFVKEDDKKCGICNQRVCEKCYNPMDENHICNKNDLETVEYIKKDSKPCPECQVHIHKISGCNQMFCTLCNTRFDWVSGKKVSSEGFHNPHMIEWQRRNAENDLNCMNILPTHHELASKISTFKLPDEQLDKLRACYLLIGMLTNRYMLDQPLENIDNTDIRIKYLSKQITEKDMLSHLKKRQKKMEKDNELRHILGMFTQVSTDIVIRTMVKTAENEILDLIEEIIKLVEYTNDSLLRIKNRFSSVVPIINMNNIRKAPTLTMGIIVYL